MARAFLLAAALAALAASGSAGCSGARCLAPPDWPRELKFTMLLPDMEPDTQRFSVDSAGKILWSGFPRKPTPVSRAELREILAVSGDLSPEPWLILDAAPDADCAAVRAVRAEMDRAPMCKRGRCVERSVWDRRAYDLDGDGKADRNRGR